MQRDRDLERQRKRQTYKHTNIATDRRTNIERDYLYD